MARLSSVLLALIVPVLLLVGISAVPANAATAIEYGLIAAGCP